MAKTGSEKAIAGIAKAINVIDSNSLQAEYLKTGKAKINEARKLLYEAIAANGYALKPNGTAYKLK
jgi:hypothetical protein